MRMSVTAMCPVGIMVGHQTVQEFVRRSRPACVGYMCWLHGEMQGCHAWYYASWAELLEEYQSHMLSTAYEKYI